MYELIGDGVALKSQFLNYLLRCVVSPAFAYPPAEHKSCIENLLLTAYSKELSSTSQGC